MPENPQLLVVVATEAERPPLGDVEVLVCGVGKTGAAVATARRLAAGDVKAVVSFGVAGAYAGRSLHVGDVVVSTRVAVLDEGLDEELADGASFRPFARSGMTVPGAEWIAVDEKLRTAIRPRPGPDFRVVHGPIGTVSVCAGSQRLHDERTRTGAIAEAMEGAAVAHAAREAGVPFLEIRGISNPCGPRDGAPFDLATAVGNATNVLAELSAVQSGGGA